VATVERQTGLRISYEKSGISFGLSTSAGIHVYRVLQEALNNAARHSGAHQAQVRLRYLADRLELDVEDRGKGLASESTRNGIGMVAMRERAELLGGTIQFTRPPEGGTRVSLTVPRESTGSNV
jgi:signal transduction histidine kinase